MHSIFVSASGHVYCRRFPHWETQNNSRESDWIIFYAFPIYEDCLCFSGELFFQENIAIIEFGAKTQVLHNLSTDYAAIRRKIGKFHSHCCQFCDIATAR